MKANTHFSSYLAEFLLEWEMLQKKVVEEIKTHFALNNLIYLFTKSSRLWDVEKYRRAGQVTDDNMAHAYCMLDN